MKRVGVVFVSFFTVISFIACSSDKFRVEGAITGAEDSTLYFEAMTLGGVKLRDSVRLDSEGSFHFSEKFSESPEFYRLRIGRQIINLASDSSATVRVEAPYVGMSTKYTVEGSAVNEQIKELSLLLQKLQEELLYIAGNNAWTPADKAENVRRSLSAYKAKLQQEYIYPAPQSASAYFAVFQAVGRLLVFDPENDSDDVKTYAIVSTAWDAAYPNSLRAQNLHNIVIEGMKNSRKMLSRTQSLDADKVVVSSLIEVALPDMNGQIRKLSDLNGKVVLLDFTQYGIPDSPQRILQLREL